METNGGRKQGWTQELLQAAVMGGLYLLGARLALFFVVQPENLALIWPSAGVLFGYLVTSERKSWPWLLSTAFAVVTASNYVAGGSSIPTSLAFAVANVTESFAAAVVVRRMLGRQLSLDSARDVSALILGAGMASNAVTGLLGASVVRLSFGGSFGALWFWWWVEDGMGILLVGSAVVLVRRHMAGLARSQPPWTLGEALAAAGAAVIIVWVFALPPDPGSAFAARPYLPVPLLLYLAVRRGPPAAVAANGLLAASAMLGLVLRQGTFITWTSDVRGQALGAQLFLAVASATTLMAAAVAAERRSAEEGLSVSEQRFRQQSQRLAEVIWGTNIGTWEWHVQTGEAAFNERWAGIVGYSLEELSPVSIATWTALAHPEDRRRSGELLERCFKREIDTYDCEARLRHKDGHWVWVQDRGRVVEWGPDGRPLRMSGTHQDITDRKLSEDRLSHAVTEQKAVLDTMPAGIWCVVDRRVVWANAAVEAVLGYSPAEVTGMDTSAFYQERRNYDDIGTTGYGMLARGGTYQCEVRMRRKKGESIWVSLAGRYVDAAHPELGAIWVIQDVTERRHAVDALAVYAEAQRALLREVNHRVKNNLAAILGVVHLEQDKAVGAGQPVAAVALKELDARLRALASVHAMLSHTEWRPVRLTDLCTRIITASIAGHGAGKPSFRIADSDVEVDSNQAHSLALVLCELATNTAKYGAGPASTLAEVAIGRSTDAVRLSYRDYGRGYPEAVLAGTAKGQVGLELIRGMVAQNLRGHLSLRNDGGAVTDIEFPAGHAGGA